MLSVIGDCPDKNLQQLFRQTVCVLAIFSILFLAGTSIAREPDEVKFPSGGLVLHGFIYRPEGSGPFPAVLWNHGSEQKPGWLPELGKIFASRGYVFFLPHRRGHGRSPGEYIMDLVNRESRNTRSRRLVELQEIHLEDQIAALSYLKQLPYVDPNRVAVAGCSFGGIQTILISEKSLGLRAAIDFAGAAMTWQGSLDLRERMLSAVRQATIPILLIQAENDYDLSPSRALAAELERLGKPHKLQIYPPFGITAKDGHGFCGARGADVWGQEVLSFLSTHMQR